MYVAYQPLEAASARSNDLKSLTKLRKASTSVRSFVQFLYDMGIFFMLVRYRMLVHKILSQNSIAAF